MATFVNIPDTDLDANSPITENLMLALRDNAIAIAEGDVTAPKIANAAFNDNSINGGKILDGTIINSKIGASSISDAKIIKTFQSQGTWTVSQNTTFWIPSGVYLLLTIGNTGVLYIGSQAGVDSERMNGIVISNGANIRFVTGVAESASIAYMRLS